MNVFGQDAWNFEPTILAAIIVPGAIYFFGLARIWHRAGVGHGIFMRQAAAFGGGLLALVVALISPLEHLSDELFSAHMLQHTLLILVSAPCFAASAFPTAAFWALPRRASVWLGHKLSRTRWLQMLGEVLFHPITAWVLFAASLWIWHIPAFYQAALNSESTHAFEHACFLLSASLFWWVLFRPVMNRATRYGISIIYLFTAGLQMSLLGALFTFAGHPLYSFYVQAMAARGLNALQDQQVAGLIMWAPGGVVFTVLSALFFIAWFNALEEQALPDDTAEIGSTHHEKLDTEARKLIG